MTEFPSQCSCGHIYLERYKWDKPMDDKGLIGFCWCGFCRTRRNVYQKATDLLEIRDDKLKEITDD